MIHYERKKIGILFLNNSENEKGIGSYICGIKNNMRISTDNAWPTHILVGTQTVNKEAIVED